MNEERSGSCPCDVHCRTSGAGPSTTEEDFFARLRMSDVTSDEVDLVMEMPLASDLLNIRGGLLGGLTATLIDIVAGRVAYEGAPEGYAVTTTDMTVHFLSQVTVGPARAVARVVRRGRRLIVMQVEVTDVGRDELAAVATLGFAVVPLPGV